MRHKLRSLVISHQSQLVETAWAAFGQIITFIVGIGGIKLLTHLMSPHDYGELALGVSVSGMVNMFLYGPLGQVVCRFFSVCRQEDKMNAYSNVLKKLYLQAAMLVIIFGVPVLVFVGYAFSIWWSILFGIALLHGIFAGLQNLPVSFFNAKRERRSVTLSQIADVSLRMVCALTLVTCVASNGVSALVGYLLGTIFVIVLINFFSKKPYKLGSNSSQRRDINVEAKLRVEFMKYGLPFVAFAGLTVISQYADRWLLQSFQSENAVGVYAAMYQIASAPTTFLMGVVNQLIIPVVFMRSADINNKSLMQNGHKLLFYAVCAVSISAFIISFISYYWGVQIITLMTNTRYTQHAGILWIIVLAVALFNIAQFMNVYGQSLNQPRVYFWPKFVQAAMILISGVPFVYYNGVVGMAEALLVSSVCYILYVIFINYNLRKRYGYFSPDLK